VASGLLSTDLYLDYVLSVVVDFLASLVTDALWIPIAARMYLFDSYPRTLSYYTIRNWMVIDYLRFLVVDD